MSTATEKPISHSNILLVDDTPDNLRLLSRILELEGYQVRGKMNGELALQDARQDPPDLILLDVMMPDMDGYQVCKYLKSYTETRDVPVIFLSAATEVADKIKAFDVGGADYVTKPFQTREILARIRYQLTIQHQKKQLIEQNLKLEIALQQAQLYQVAQAQVKELERLNQLKDDFLSTISHELRTPISSIEMAAQTLEYFLQQSQVIDSERQQFLQYLRILKEECKREMKLVNDLLDLSHIDAGVEPLTVTELNLQAWIPHIVESFEPRFKSHQQTFILQLPPDLPLLSTDIVDLERILDELLNNACKYTPAGETISITAQADSATLKICISNSGVEIPEEERDRIFDKFYRIPNEDPWKYAGMGLGLSLVKKRVERLGATIQVESKERQTTFTLLFPRKLKSL